MTLATHVFRKDVRHLRMLIIVWLVVVVLQAVFAGSDLAYTAESRSVQWTLLWLTRLTSFLSIALAIAIVPLFIQDDSTVGTTAFWLSRPFSRWDLLLGKMSFLIAILVIPSLIAEIVLLIVYRVTAHDIALAVPEIFFTNLTFLIPLTVLAVLTPSLPRFILVGVATLVGLILIAAVAASLMFYVIEEREVFTVSGGRLPALAGLLAPSVFGWAIVAHQYFTRKTARSVLFIVLGFILFSLSGYFWPWDPAKPDRPEVNQRLFDSDRVGVALDAQSVSASDSFSFRATERPRKTIAGSFELSDVRPEFMVVPEYIDATLRFPDGTTIKFDRPARRVSGGSYWNYEALRKALDSARLVYPERYYPDGERSSWRILEVDARVYDRYKQKVGLLSGNVRFHVSRHRVAGELPLMETARMQKLSDHVLIDRMLEYPNGRRLIVREGNLNLVLSDVRGFNPLMRLYVLLNRSRGEAILPREQPLTRDMYFADFYFGPKGGRFGRNLAMLDFSGESRTGQSAIQLDAGWLSDARLVRVEVEDLGYFSKPLRVENFRMMIPAQQQLNQSAPAQ